jgi:hypothetical protein
LPAARPLQSYRQVVTEQQLAGCHPAYAAYVYAQNQVSVMSEQLTGLKEMAPFAHIVSEAEDLYMPSAPPMSPLTTSYFTCDAERDGVVCRYTPNLARHPWRAHRGPGVRWFRSIRRGQIPSLESCMASIAKYLLYRPQRPRRKPSRSSFRATTLATTFG